MRPMKQAVALFAFVLILSASSQAQSTTDNRLLSDAEYRALLNQLDAHFPEWERALQSIDPAKNNVSYAVGRNIVRYRDLALMEVKNARYYVQQERAKRRISRELGLQLFLQSVFDSMETIIVEDPTIDVPLEKYAPKMSELISKLGNDTIARVELLEKAACP
jgi:hypothetical protein